MRGIKLLVFLLLISSGAGSAESANLLDEGRCEVGLFQPLRWGYSKNIEFSMHPILMFAIPNISIKIRHEKYNLTSRHEVFYPTPLLRVLQKEGMFGIVTPVADIGEMPHIIGFHNQLLKSIDLKRALLTIKGGFEFSIISDNLDERSTTDLPLVYPSMGSFFNGYKFNFGIDVRYNVSNEFSILLDGDAVLIPSENIFGKNN